jgi:Flp pilus assembly protein TadG
LVEAAIVANLLFLLLFGIVTAGVLLSYRQNMVQAANEAARAGAVTNDASAALAAAQSAVSGFDRSCNAKGLTCTVETIPCPSSAAEQCVRVVLEQDNADSPIVAPMPLVSMLVPDRMRVEAIAVVNP